MISFLVSAFDRPWHLAACLGSLVVQKSPHEIIVCDNSIYRGQDMPSIANVCSFFWVRAVVTSRDTLERHTCYHSVGITLRLTRGEWLCFPSEDSYYVPRFAEIMLTTALENHLDFVYCDTLYDPRYQGRYSIMNVQPSLGRIDKTCMMVKREWFEKVGGWQAHPNDWQDGALAEKLVREGARHAKAPGVMCVHN